MGWSGGFEDVLGRPAGYGVDATCDFDGCDEKIHRGLGYICGAMHGGEDGCGLYFCGPHRYGDHECSYEGEQ